jgi:hypothetical protein
MLGEGEGSLNFRNEHMRNIKRDPSTPLRSARNHKGGMIERSSGGNLGDFRKRGLL